MFRKIVFLQNKSSELSRLHKIVEKLGQREEISFKTLHAIDLSLDEIFTNIVSYGFREQGGYNIAFDFSVYQDCVIIIIEDNGRAFNPLNVPDPDITKPLEERPIGGLGLFLVRKMMDKVEYCRKENKNILILTKNRNSIN